MGNFAKKYQYYLVASTVLTWRENDHVQQFNKNYFRIQIFSCKTDTVHDTPDMAPKSVVSSLNYFLPNTNCTEAEIYVYSTLHHITLHLVIKYCELLLQNMSITNLKHCVYHRPLLRNLPT